MVLLSLVLSMVSLNLLLDENTGVVRTELFNKVLNSWTVQKYIFATEMPPFWIKLLAQ